MSSTISGSQVSNVIPFPGAASRDLRSAPRQASGYPAPDLEHEIEAVLAKLTATACNQNGNAPDSLSGLLVERLQKSSARAPEPDAPQRIAIISLEPTECIPTKKWLDWWVRRTDAIVIRSAGQEEPLQDARSTIGRPFVHVADHHQMAWASHCIRRCDLVLFIVSASSHVVDGSLIDFAKSLRRDTRLILCHPTHAAAPSEGTRWLQHFQAMQILHARSGNESDYERVLRLTSRSGVCVVFSGGGARALAHIGTVLALEERSIPIDAVGGTSMGALVAGLAAQGRNGREIFDEMRRHLFDCNPMSDYTFPFVSLVRGRKMTHALREVFGGTLIENLWKTFFCLSTDLTKQSAMVHRSGPLWLALRASTAIPGILPPVICDRRVLVDGGIMDNFPTTVMRAMQCGPIIGADVSSDFRITAPEMTIEGKSWIWLLRHGGQRFPSLARILMSAVAVNSGCQLAASRAAADALIQPKLDGINMLSFKAFDRAVEAGYQATLEALSHLNLTSRVGRAALPAAASRLPAANCN
jgi:predicted acylesterase/phospholipase RssA